VPEAIVVAVIAGFAGISGALLGSWIAARATRAATLAALANAEADRREARRARFSDAIRDLAIEALEAADTDVAEIREQWRVRDLPEPTEIAWRSGYRAKPVLRRIRMLVVEPRMRAAVDELDTALDAVEALSIRSVKSGARIFAPQPFEDERAKRSPATVRFHDAVKVFETEIRTELGSEG